MISNLKYATISQIGITDLFFYDPQKEQECAAFCKQNLISYLPSRDRKFVFKFENDGFTKMRLESFLMVNPFDRIFDTSTLNKFEKVNHNEIRFITEKSKIKGVVHIVDYNNEHLQVEFYRSFYRFENMIRNLLINNGFQNKDFIQWVRMMSQSDKDKEFWEKRYETLMPVNELKLKIEQEKRSSSNPFQTFYLKELLLFSIDQEIIDKKLIHLDSVCSLRNEIAHNKDFTSKSKDEQDGLVYNFKNLKAFVKKANEFFEAYEYVEESMVTYLNEI